MATQLDQLLAYLDRPGVSELTFCVGKPITMRTTKGVMNVTGRTLGFDQMASLVRGTPLEALVADESIGDEPVQIALGARDVTIEIVRGGEHPSLCIKRIPDKQKPPRGMPAKKPRGKAQSDRPRDRSTSSVVEEPPRVAEPPRVEVPPKPDIVKPARTTTAPRSAPTVRPAPTQNPPFATLMGLPTPIAPASAAPVVAPLAPEPEPELPPPPPPPAARAKAPSIGPPGLDLDDPDASPAFDLELALPTKPAQTSSKPLRIDMRKMTEAPPLPGLPSTAPAPITRGDASGIIAIDRAPGMPLTHEARSLAALGLPDDIAATVARERGLVLITAPQGHGKTSTLAALFDRIDRAVVPHVVTIDALRDRESIDLALSTAESGYFVLATLTAPSPAAAIDVLLDSYPGMAHGRVKTRLASVLVALIAKRLPPTPSEIMLGQALRAML